MIDQKLITFLAVCQYRNFTVAAKQLNLTQPAISQHIKQLESELDITIFNRTNNELKLTNEGNILLKYARRIASLYKDLETKIEDEKKQTKSLVIGITHTAESNVIAEVLAIYCAENKGLRIKIITDTIRNLYDKLSTYEIDLAIVEGQLLNKKYNSILLDTDSLVAVMSNQNPLAKNQIININDLKKEKMILRSPTSQTRSLFVSQLENLNISIEEFNIILEIDNIATIKDLIAKNMAVSVLPKSTCYSELKNNSLAIRPIENVNIMRQTNIVFSKDFTDRYILDELLSIYHSIVH